MDTLPRHIKNAISEWLSAKQDSVYRIESIASGDTSSARVLSKAGFDLFVKWRDDVVEDMFEAETQGLLALSRRNSGLRIPKVCFHDEKLIAMDYIATRPPSEADWQALGIGLAQLHSESVIEFGFPVDTFCGPTRQRNKTSGDGFQFFAEQRLLPLTEIARNKGLLQRKDCKAIESLCAQLASLLPLKPACLIHGDLWNGNVLFAQSGAPVLIDPAAYHGWAEADLAMTTLFGGFSDAFYGEYQNHSPVDPHWRQRADTYNLYHLLNHLVLFGEQYRSAVVRILKGFYV